MQMDQSRSHDATNSTCFSGILRRLLCSGALPTHPADTIVVAGDSIPKTEKCGTTPGIVARLMGLDSLPETDSITRRTTLESILRSRSVNSVNYIPEFDLLQTHHRRAKTSVSFREIPTFINEPNHDFVVLCFERVGEISNGKRLSEKKSVLDMGFETEIKKQKKVKTERKRNQDAVKAKSSEKLVKKRRKKKKKTGNQTRPVSVLQQEPRLSERSRKPVSSSRRSSRGARKDEEFDYFSSRRSQEEGEDKSMKSKEGWDENHVKLVEQIQSLSDEHIERDSQWADKRFEEEVEEICYEFGQDLLDHMFEQVVDELCRICMDYNSNSLL
ncbi:uncharacterized protein LOC124940008 [Impatiens glandulifera]|uniref:uncharacterized protein LOC124940008 n=1 Tax=Impatiens glandulifera TaxID=253017 RepID=UPI001FB0FB2C|nr:uncharacterized protein LOC124940008 [Impatiens glandulifera]